MSALFKTCSVPTSAFRIEKRPDLLQRALDASNLDATNSEFFVSFKDVEDYFRWEWVSCEPPKELCTVQNLSAKDVDSFIKYREENTYRFGTNKHSSPETFVIDLQDFDSAYSSDEESDTEGTLEELKVTTLFRELQQVLENRKMVKKSEPGDSVMPRAFFYEASEETPVISPNQRWHIDFFATKSDIELARLLSENEVQFICTITDEKGPTTLALDACEIEIPVVNYIGSDRKTILDLYIDELIKEGIVSAYPLKPSVFYAVYKNMLHRGPRKTDTQFQAADRAFFHLTS